MLSTWLCRDLASRAPRHASIALLLFLSILLSACGSSAAAPTPVPTVPNLRSYQSAVLPVLTQSVTTFNQASRRVAHIGNLTSLAGTCQGYRPIFDGLRVEFDSVPRVGPWYTASGVLHRRAMGLYHAMLGTIDACQLASDNDDPAGARTMKHDMAAETVKMADLRDSVKRSLRHTA